MILQLYMSVMIIKMSTYHYIVSEFVWQAVHPSLQCLIVTLELCPEKD